MSLLTLPCEERWTIQKHNIQSQYVFVAVNKDGQEVMSNWDLKRLSEWVINEGGTPADWECVWTNGHHDDWAYCTGSYDNTVTRLPTGFIFAVTGKHLTWEDEPLLITIKNTKK